MCIKDIELLSVSLRPQYLPWEFPQLFITVVYIHPRTNEANAAETLGSVVHKLQWISPDAPNLIMGDFNKCSMKQCLRNFYQYVFCPTRFNKTLDLCYGSVKGAYKSVVKGIVHPKMKILSSFTHPQVFPNLYECLCSAEHKGRYSEESL